jgi:hypothetical protein
VGKAVWGGFRWQGMVETGITGKMEGSMGSEVQHLTKPNSTFFFLFNITSFKMFYYFKKNLAVCFAIFPLLLRCEVSFSLFQETDRYEKRSEKVKCFAKWPLF